MIDSGLVHVGKIFHGASTDSSSKMHFLRPGNACVCGFAWQLQRPYACASAAVTVSWILLFLSQAGDMISCCM